MRAIFNVAAVAACGLLLTACNTTNFNSTLHELSLDYAHCHHTVTYSASVGAMNPGSGAQVQGSVDCPAVPPAAPGSSATPATSGQPG